MAFSKCPSCDHEIYDRKAASCPFCGQELGRSRMTGGTGEGMDQRARVRIVLLVAMLMLSLVGGIVAFLVSAKV